MSALRARVAGFSFQVWTGEGAPRAAQVPSEVEPSAGNGVPGINGDGLDATMAIVGNERLAAIAVPPDGSETIGVTLTARRSGDADVTFTARDESGTTVLSVKDKFVER